MWSTVLGDPGAVSRVGKKGAKKVFKHGQKSLWVPTHQIISNRTVKRMLAPDWAQKTFVLLCPVGEQNLMSSFRVFVHYGYCLARKKNKNNPPPPKKKRLSSNTNTVSTENNKDTATFA